MPFMSTREALANKHFVGALIGCMIFNFGINFGIGYLTFTGWGKFPLKGNVWLFKWDPYLNSNLTLDLVLTCFFMAFFTCLLGAQDAVKKVKKGQLDVVSMDVLQRGIWRYLPVRSTSNCNRSFLLALIFLVIYFGPIYAVFAGVISSNECQCWGGIGYVTFKATFGFFEALFIYPIAHVGATSINKFENDDTVVAHVENSGAEDGGNQKIPLVGVPTSV